jgi:hypothetical protein
MAAALATAMGGAQTTINLSYRNGGRCSWAMAGQRLCNVKGKGDDGSNGDGDDRVRSEEAMPPNPQQYFWIIPFWNRVSAPQPHPNTQNKRIIPFWNSPPKPTTIFTDYSILE